MLGLPQSVCLELSASEQGAAARCLSGHTPPTAPRGTILGGRRVDVGPAAGQCDALSVLTPVWSPERLPATPLSRRVSPGPSNQWHPPWNSPSAPPPKCPPPMCASQPLMLDTQLPGSGQKFQEAVGGPTRLLPSMGPGSRAGGCACVALSEEERSPGPIQPTVCVFSFHRTAPSSIRRTSSSKCGSCSPLWGQGWGRPPWGRGGVQGPPKLGISFSASISSLVWAAV